MEQACPACGAPVTITRYHTAVSCPWCHNTLYPTPGDALLFFQIPSALSPLQAKQTLIGVLRGRGLSMEDFTITSQSTLNIPFMKTPEGAWASCGEESFLELNGYVPRADRVIPLETREAPSLHFEGTQSPHSLFLIPFTLFTGNLEGHPVRMLIDNVTGGLYTADLPDHLSRLRIRQNRNVLLFLIISSFAAVFFLIKSPLLLLLSLAALFFFGMAFLKGG